MSQLESDNQKQQTQEGQPSVPESSQGSVPQETQASEKEIESQVIDALKSTFDPEIPVNIYELGLVYKIIVTPEKEVTVRMTLTSPACPVAGSLPPEVENKIKLIPGVTQAKVELVWDPPWERDMMSEAAKLQLNMY